MKSESLRDHNPVETRSEEAATHANMLAPLEELEVTTGAQHRRHGAILLDTAQLKLPKEFLEEDKKGKFFGLEPVVIFILLLVLAFIALITYLISIEPAS